MIPSKINKFNLFSGFAILLFLYNTITLASDETYIFDSTRSKIRLVYKDTVEIDVTKTPGKLTFKNRNQISIKVYNNSRLVFSTTINGKFRKPFVEFLPLNNDGVLDIILHLADESGFEPFILLSKSGSKKYVNALRNIKKYISVDYSNLESSKPGEPHKSYQVIKNKLGVNFLVFHHLFIERKLRYKVKLKLNEARTAYSLEK